MGCALLMRKLVFTDFFVVIVLVNINTHVHIRICNFVNISNCWEGG